MTEAYTFWLDLEIAYIEGHIHPDEFDALIEERKIEDPDSADRT